MRGAAGLEIFEVQFNQDQSQGRYSKMDENRATQDIPATLKQIGFLYVLGAQKIPKDLSRAAASEKIDELLAQQSE